MVSDSREQAIREIAYHKWEQAGQPICDGITFWLEAEQEFLGQPPCEESTCCSELTDSDMIPESPPAKSSSVPPPPLLSKVKANSRRKVG